VRVLYVSKALRVAAYRDKIVALGAHVSISGIMPDRWDDDGAEGRDDQTVPVSTWPVQFPGRPHLHVYRRPRDLFDEQRPDIVHIDEEPYSAVTFQLVRHCRRRKLPALFFAWQTIGKRLPPPFGAMRRYVFQNVAGAIAGTDTAGTLLRAFGYESPMTVIPQFGVDPRRFAPSAESRRQRRAALDIGTDDFVVGYCGRLVREKGVHVLIEAVHRTAAVRLVVVGVGPERWRLEQQVRTLGLGERVRFVGLVRSTDVPGWMNLFDVLALPSLTTSGWTEQFGRVLVEAMSCGIPTVGSTSGEIPRVIGDAGLTVSEGDARAWAAAIARLGGSVELRMTLAERGLERVGTRYTQQRIAEATVAFYRRLLDRERPA
jgi:glycosyltransferase involved in cell wall biosynthesis